MFKGLALLVLSAAALAACSTAQPAPALLAAASANNNVVQVCLNGTNYTPSATVGVRYFFTCTRGAPMTLTAQPSGSFSALQSFSRDTCDFSCNKGQPSATDVVAVDKTSLGTGAAALGAGYFCGNLPVPGPDPNWAKCCQSSGVC
jgi:hypothetical protein